MFFFFYFPTDFFRFPFYHVLLFSHCFISLSPASCSASVPNNICAAYEKSSNRNIKTALNSNRNCTEEGNISHSFPSFCLFDLYFPYLVGTNTVIVVCVSKEVIYDVTYDFAGDVKSLYEKATVPAKPEVPMTPMTKRTRVDIERDQRELQEEIENREALRNHMVPGYFESEMGKAFLLSQVSLYSKCCIVNISA